MWGMALYPSEVFSRRPQSIVLYDLRSYRDIAKMGSWSTLANFCTKFRSKIVVPVPPPLQKPCNASWRQTLAFRRVSTTASTTLHSDSKRTTPMVSVFPLGISTRIVHLIYLGISLCCHMNWVIYTSICHHSGLAGLTSSSPGITSIVIS